MMNMSNKKIDSSTKCYYSHFNLTFEFALTVYKDVLFKNRVYKML